ncbi:MAG: methyltransferase, partial [Acidobacteriaceae bacterium]|nr:methyltransferase [Acidobacteriaceae bacterium]
LLNQLVKLLAAEIAPIPKALLLEHDTIEAVCEHLINNHLPAVEAKFSAKSSAETAKVMLASATEPRHSKTKPAEFDDSSEKIAIVGLAGRYPGARNLEDFWTNLAEGRSTIGGLPLSRWPDGNEGRDRHTRIGAFLDDVAGFDPVFFGISAVEARSMKPEERLLLELAVEAFETAGYSTTSPLCAKTGVYVGVTANTYPLLAYAQCNGSVSLDTSLFSLANRISHALKCEGPSLTLDTGCCSALSAIHLASDALRSGSVRMALAGAVNLILHPSKYELFENGNLIASTPHQGLFPVNGPGFIPGEGAGMVVLKTLRQAQEDGDFIWGVISGSALTHKGGGSNFRLPSPKAAKSHLSQLLENARTQPAAINFVELQALGSELSDSSEWAALLAVLGSESKPCAAGSVKLAIGHLEAASGMAQLTKVLLQLRHRRIPPSSLALDHNPEIQPAQTRFFLPEKLTDWVADGIPRCALISSSGVGGALASLIITEAPERADVPEARERKAHLVVLSAKTEAQLEQRRSDLVRYVRESEAQPAIADVAFTLQQGRDAYRYRWAAVIKHLDDLLDPALKSWQGCVEISDSHTDPESIQDAAMAWVKGSAIPERFLSIGRRVPLPTYPFERIRCWIDAPAMMAEQRQQRICGPSEQPEPKQTTNVVVEYYNRVTETLAGEIGSQDVHLVFAPFTDKIPGFSWLLTFFEPNRNREHYQMMLDAQRELKRVLVRHIDWTRTRRVLDIGCGLATDLLQLSREHPHIQAVGYTITPKQAELGRQRVAAAGLSDRVQIFNRDSTRDEFPGEFDAALGFEVLFHIQDKSAVLGNLTRHLVPGGTFVVADCLANTVSDINRSEVGLFTNHPSTLAAILAENNLEVISCVDVGQEMSHFLDDEKFEENLAYVRSRYPEMIYGEPEHRTWHNCGKAFALKLIRYVLLTIRHTSSEAAATLRARNLACLQSPISYAEAVAQLKDAAATKQLSTPHHLSELRQLTADVLGIPIVRLDDHVPLAEYGVDSLVGLKLIDTLNRQYGLQLEMQVLFDCPTIAALGRCIEDRLPSMPLPEPASASKQQSESEDLIAIIGMAGRFPGASNIEEFWKNLENGVDSISEIPLDRWDTARFYDPDANKPGRSYSRWGGFLSGVDQFDAGFFRITRAEAEVMDPQQRLFLETCWEALEDAGHAGPALRGSACGVVAGVFNNDYQLLLAKASGTRNMGHAMLGNADAILAARINYFLDLKGPALCVDSACSSSLVAIHLACQSLRNGDADMMLAGGVTLYLDETPYLMMSKAGMLSPTGKCRSFSAEADGITTGEAVGVVVLKRMADAIRDGDHIRGVIRGSGANQDGQTNGITAPSREAQKALLRQVYRKTGINPETISYVEAHGTGTKLGDPVEAAALIETFREFTTQQGFCTLGSVKSNIGHTSAASGVTGLIKVLLSIQHGLIPPTLHATSANPLLHLDGSPFILATQARPWSGPYRAAVSSFGFSGTNCHLVVDGPPANLPSKPDCESVVTLSAATSAQLRELAQRLHRWLEVNPSVRVCDIAWTLQKGRTPFSEHVQLICNTPRQLAQELHNYLHSIPSAAIHLGGMLPQRELPSDVRRVPLPTYPFVRERYWLRQDSSVILPGASKAPVRELTLRVEDEVLIREHSIGGRPCLPTDALLDLVYRHAAERLGPAPLRIRDVTLYTPLFCEPGETKCLTVVD